MSDAAFTPTKEPKDFLGHPLRSVCGMREYEWALRDIINFLASDKQTDLMHWEDGIGWDKLFRMADFQFGKDLFAMMCADGWISSCHFPKYTFRLSDRAIQVLHEKAI